VAFFRVVDWDICVASQLFAKDCKEIVIMLEKEKKIKAKQPNPFSQSSIR
jgi:hypothetical protein